MLNKLKSALDDFSTGCLLWRIWASMALLDVRRRYRRSMLGQFWITVSMLLTIVCLGFVYSKIFQLSLNEYLPYISISIIMWNLISSSLNDGCQSYIESEGVLKSASFPLSIYAYRTTFRGVLVFLHNFVLIIFVFLYFDLELEMNSLTFIPALSLVLINSFCFSLILGTLSARYRDIPQIVASIVQIGFFISPIIWEAKQLPLSAQFLVEYNPFAIFLNILRNPFLNTATSQADWFKALLITFITALVSTVLFSRHRTRIAYYV